MDYLLVLSGIALILFALWRDRLKEDLQIREMDKYKQLQSELTEAKKEVGVLLQQLEAASERIVEEISFGLEEIQYSAENYIDKMNQQQSPELTEAISVDEYKTKTAPSMSTSGRAAKTSSAKTSSAKTVVFPTVKNTENKQKDLSQIKQPQEQIPPKHQVVCSMARMGYSEEEIAKKMNIGKGEVRLILKLKHKGEEANA